MTFWKVEDRQGLSLFTQRPVYSTIHDMWMGTRARRLQDMARIGNKQ